MSDKKQTLGLATDLPVNRTSEHFRYPQVESVYPHGSEFGPGAKKLGKQQSDVLELLKQRGPLGATRIDSPQHLILSMPARICELRKMGYRIDTTREQVGHSSIARYVLVTAEGDRCDPHRAKEFTEPSAELASLSEAKP